jgi:hypothetical protein
MQVAQLVEHPPYTRVDVACKSHPAYLMKALLLSCAKFDTKIKSLATRPAHIVAEPVNQTHYALSKCIVVLITVEKDDFLQTIATQLEREIRVFSADTGISSIVLYPFGHLSSNLARSEEVIKALDEMEMRLADFGAMRVHFGSNKSLLLDIHGHKGNARFRNF